MADGQSVGLIRGLKATVRGATSLALFALFGFGALFVSLAVAALRRPERGQPVVRAAWRFILSLFVATRLIQIDRGNLAPMRGTVIAASHPSLIDVVILTALVPRTLYVAKRGLRANPFLAAIVRATALPDDADLPARATPYLRQGWNVLIFPEGTRSPEDGGLNPLHRGAAQLALRAGVPLACVRMDVSRRILGKRQRPWDMGTDRVTYALRVTMLPATDPSLGNFHVRAKDLTDRMRSILI